MNGTCCVFQPFDKGRFDKRYRDIISPAILRAGLDPYRVDEDDSAVIPIDTLHAAIQSATLCLADITTRNPNVMYELGFAIASDKDVILICSTQNPEKFPFDIQHRGIISYSSDSVSDFEALSQAITSKANAILKKQASTVQITDHSPIRSVEGLQPNEISTLAIILASTDSFEEGVTSWTVKQEMSKAGYNDLATRLALLQLARIDYIEEFSNSNFRGEEYTAIRLTRPGEDWLLENRDQLELKPSRRRSTKGDQVSQRSDEVDIPF